MTAAEPDTALPLEPTARVPEIAALGGGAASAEVVEFRPAFALVGVLGLHRGIDPRRGDRRAGAGALRALKSDFRNMTKPPAAPHYFGTDQIGRDTLSRVIYGSRASLAVAIGAVLFGTTLGSLWAWRAATSAAGSIYSASALSSFCNPSPI